MSSNRRLLESPIESDDGTDCCVCLEPTAVLTPCAHRLCEECRSRLRKAACPLCRRSLPGPAYLDRDREHAVQWNSRSFPQWSRFSSLNYEQDRNLETPSSSSRSLSEAAGPSRVARNSSVGRSLRSRTGHTGVAAHSPARRRPQGCSRRLLLKCELARFRNLSEAISCAEELACYAAHNGSSGDVIDGSARHCSNVETRVLESLSEAVASLVLKISLGNLSPFASRLCILIGKHVLLPVRILPAVRDVVRRAAEEELVHSETAWKDVLELVGNLQCLRQFEMLQPFITSVEKKVSKRVVQAVHLTFLVRPISDFKLGIAVLEHWPAVGREARAAIGAIVQGRLLAAAKGFARASLPSASLDDFSQVESAMKQVDAPWCNHSLDAIIEALQAAATWDFLDRASLTYTCEVLVPGLVRERIKTQGTITWAPAASAPVVARQLASNLLQDPANIQYNDAGKMLTFIKFSESDAAGLFRDGSSRSYGSLSALPDLSAAQPTEPSAASRRGADGMDNGASYTQGIGLTRQLHYAL